MKKVIIIVVLVLGLGGWFYYKNNDANINTQQGTNIINNNIKNTNMTSQVKEISVSVKKEGPFKYFQLNIETATGLVGKVILNGHEITKFGEKGLQGSFNQAQDFILDGKNQIELTVDSIVPNAKPGGIKFDNDALINIGLNAMDVADFPKKENQVLLISWNKGDPDRVSYVFSIKRNSEN